MKCSCSKHLKLFLLLFALSDITYGQKFTYFPLAVGNKWFFSGGNLERIVGKYEVEKDTVLDDGKLYSKIMGYSSNIPDSGIFQYSGQTYYLRNENNKIINYLNKLLFDFDMVVNDSVYGIEGYSDSKQVLKSIGFIDVFGRSLSTYWFFSTDYDYTTYTDSIGFNTLHATTYANWVPQYLLGCVIDNKVYGKVITGIKLIYKNSCIFKVYNSSSDKIRIKYSIPTNEHVTIKLFDMQGKEKMTLVDNFQISGIENDTEFNLNSRQKGIYLCVFKSGNYFTTKKLVLF